MNDERTDILRRELARMGGNDAYEFDALKGELLGALDRVRTARANDLDALAKLLSAERFRVVSADAVVINRDDIPDGLAAAVANVGQVIADLTDESWGPLDIDWLEDAEEKFEALARLLSGGSPAAPEDGTDGS